MNKLVIAVNILMFLLLTGCATQGNEMSESVTMENSNLTNE
jgi:outer membrane lipoprotein SlyB